MINIMYIVTVFILLGFSLVNAQYTISGVILDAGSDQPLVAANIQIANTYTGTITNQDGKFVLEVKSPEAVLIVSYIGYASQQVTVREQDAGKNLRIYLRPVILEGEPIVVIAEDPGMRIMREVIKRKRVWQDKLRTYTARAYSRIILENDSGIVSLAESTSETFWDRDRGPREVIKTKEQSSNLSEQYNIAFASYIPNLYNDDIDIVGFKVFGPTHPDAFDYYEFKLEETTQIDTHKVFWIRVIPISKLQPTFSGKLAVLDEAYALLEAELIPYKTIRFPMPIESWDIYYRQQFRNYGKEYWLPVDLRMSGTIKIGFTGLDFPRITYQRIASLSDYRVNIDLPDSLYAADDFLSVDSIALNENLHVRAIPLTKQEDLAYQELDSTMTLEKAFKPSGFLASMVEFSSSGNQANISDRDRTFLSYLDPALWYNRVDGLHLGLSVSEPLFGPLSFRLAAAYKTGLKKGSYYARLRWTHGESLRWNVNIAAWTGSDLRYGSDSYSQTVASVLPLLALDDYFDYFWNKYGRIELACRVPDIRSEIAVQYKYQEHTSLTKNTDFNFVWSNYSQRQNPAINEGIMRTIEFRYSYGEQFIPFGVIGQKGIDLRIEHTLSGDFDFTVYRLRADWRIKTFLPRRLLPNVIDMHLTAGTHSGAVPIQRFGITDAAFYPFGPFGTFKTLLGRPYEGEKYLALFWEHNFRTVPFELLNWDFFVEKGIGLILHGGHGRTWIATQRLQILEHDFNYPDQFHHEIGLAVNGILGLIRVDITQRIDNPALYIGIALNRFF